MSATRLTPSQCKVLVFISSQEKIPSMKAIASHVGWKTNSSALDCLQTLVCAGYVGMRQKAIGYEWWVTEAGRERAREIEALA